MLNIADDKFVDMDLCYVKTEEILLKNHLERLTFLTKSSYRVVEKDVYAKLGDNVSLTLPCSLKFVAPCVYVWYFNGSSHLQRDECISHALEAEGITTTNPRDVVSDNFLCTGGQTPFREHKACAGLYPPRWNLAVVIPCDGDVLC